LSYYIYENWTVKKARIHKGVCVFCNNGEGIHKNPPGEKNGKWRGPFDLYNSAKKVAQSLRNRILSDCKICEPNL